MSIEAKVKELVVEQLGVSADEVKPESSFMESLGADSLNKQYNKPMKIINNN